MLIDRASPRSIVPSQVSLRWTGSRGGFTDRVIDRTTEASGRGRGGEGDSDTTVRFLLFGIFDRSAIAHVDASRGTRVTRRSKSRERRLRSRPSLHELSSLLFSLALPLSPRSPSLHRRLLLVQRPSPFFAAAFLGRPVDRSTAFSRGRACSPYNNERTRNHLGTRRKRIRSFAGGSCVARPATPRRRSIA